MTWSATLTTPLSKSQIQRLRRKAKRLALEQDVPHLSVLHELATERGYADWSRLLRAAKAMPVPRPEPADAQPVDAKFESAYERTVAQMGLRNPPSLQEVLEAMNRRPSKCRSAHREDSAQEVLTPTQMTRFNAARRIAVAIVASTIDLERVSAAVAARWTSAPLYLPGNATTCFETPLMRLES